MPVAALAIPAAIGGITSIVGGVMGSNASQSAANTQANAEKQVAQIAQQATQNAQGGVATDLSNITAALAPYLTAGNTGIGMLGAATAPGGSLSGQFNFDPSQLASNPAYQFQLQQGLQALQNSAAARGVTQSGGTMKDVMDYAQSLAGTSYNNAFNQSLTTFQTNRNNALQNIQQYLGLGTTGTGLYDQAQQWAGTTSGQFGMQGAQITGQALTGAANAQAAGTIGSANAWSNALSGIGQAAQGYSMGTMLNNAQVLNSAPPIQTGAGIDPFGGYLGQQGYGTTTPVATTGTTGASLAGAGAPFANVTPMASVTPAYAMPAARPTPPPNAGYMNLNPGYLSLSGTTMAGGL